MTITLTEDRINETHKADIAELIAKHGDYWTSVPDDLARAVDEKARLNWVQFKAETEGTDTTGPKRDKSRKLHDWLGENVGLEVDAAALAEAVHCSTSTAYTFISSNRSAFVASENRGSYIIVDVESKRATARNGRRWPKLVAPASKPATAPTTADATGDAVAGILNAMTGDAARGPSKA